MRTRLRFAKFERHLRALVLKFVEIGASGGILLPRPGAPQAHVRILRIFCSICPFCSAILHDVPTVGAKALLGLLPLTMLF